VADAWLAELTLDRTSGVPLYVQLREALRRIITSGVLPNGACLPSETELSKTLHISRMTVRNALTDLERAGLIIRAQGVGTVVNFSHFEHNLKALTSFTEDIRGRGMVPSSKLLEVSSVPAPEPVAKALGLPTGATVDRVRRLRLANSRPAGIHDAYLLRGAVDLTRLDENASLYQLLEGRGIVLTAATETLEAVAAGDDEAQLLQLPAGAPLLQVVRTTLGRRPGGRFDEPIEYVVARYRPDLYRYSVSLQRTVASEGTQNGLGG